MKKIICDIDGVLCENERVPYKNKEPFFVAINLLNKIYKKHNIILFSSRKARYRKLTILWLKKHQVKYHKLIMNKPKGDYYIDDKSVTTVSKCAEILEG